MAASPPTSSEFLAAVLEHTRMLAAFLDARFNFIWVNRAFAETWQHPPSSFPGRNHFDLHPDPEKQATFQRVVDTREPCSMEGCPLELPGQPERGVTYWDWTLVPVKDADGAVTWLVLTLAEVTRRRRAEDALRESEERFRSMTEQTRDVIALTDARGTLTYLSPACRVLFGRDPGQMCGRPFWEFLDEGSIPKAVAAFRSDVTGGEPTRRLELVMTRQGGSTFVGELSASAFRQGADTGTLVVIRDVTERVRAEQALRESEERLRHVTNNLTEAQRIAQIGSFEYDPRGDTLFWSDEVLRIFGVPRGEFTGRLQDFADRIHPDDRERVTASIRLALSGTPVPDAIRHLIVRPDGEIRTVVETFEVVLERGAVARIVGTSQDVTDQKRAALERAALEAQLVQAQKMESVGRLAGGVAHDFNNMLGVIFGHVEMALEQVGPSAPIRSELEGIRKAAERSAELTRQLLAFARKQTVAPKVLDLNDTVGGMLKMLKRLIGEDVDLVWRPSEAVWPVRIDPSQVDQVLANLCVNARDAIVDVGTITIETANRTLDEAFCAHHPDLAPGEYVALVVTDDGCGMDAETLAHAFEPFFTTKGPAKGTGLGLATVYGAVRQNAGGIIADSRPGEGTALTIFLPRHGGAVEAVRPRTGSGPAVRGHETILLVEDEPAILKLTARMLSKQGYQVLAAAAPGEALRLARAHQGDIHLVMTDVVMPEMNGRELVRNLLPLFPDIKRLFMSGYTADVIGHHSVLEDGVHFLPKPFRPHDLAAKVREALDGD
jgi:two-component system cell cycle sensor histidine kinase/response regulator CckA